MVFIVQSGVKNDRNHQVSGNRSHFQVAITFRFRVIVKKHLRVLRVGRLSQNSILKMTAMVESTNVICVISVS